LMWSVLLQPMIWLTIAKFGNPDTVFAGDTMNAVLSAKAAAVLGEAVVVTLAIFIGLTATVFITRKDFSFMRGALSIATFALIGVALASVLFGFQIGVLYSGLVVLLMAGYILFQTSLVMSYFRPTQHVAAALMLFGTVVTLFIHVLRIVGELNRR
jgi:FtsH-binding integral membrane protein